MIVLPPISLHLSQNLSQHFLGHADLIQGQLLRVCNSGHKLSKPIFAQNFLSSTVPHPHVYGTENMN